LCQALLAQGYSIRALVRSPEKASRLLPDCVELVEGDLNNRTALAELIRGCSHLVHSAGAVRGNSQADFDKVNVVGTANLIDAINTLGQPLRLVLLSSIVAREPQLSFYSRSKRKGEDLLTKKQTEFDWVVIRPPAVYGPGDKEMLPIFQTMAKGLVTIPGAPESRTSLIHVSDLVNAITACMDSDGAVGNIFEVGDTAVSGYSWLEMTAIAEAVFARQIRLWQVPAWLLNTIARINSALAGISGRDPMLTPPKLRELRHPDWVTDTSPITSATGWTPSVGLSEGLRQLEL
jgi:nucleoside-diphosphate-sugar epimerase